MVVRVKIDPDTSESTTFLTQGNCYRVLTVSYNRFRVLADDGRPCLYEKELFEIILDTKPSDWVTEVSDDGRLIYEGPLCFAKPGYWEDCFDGEAYALRALWMRLSAWAVGEDFFVIECPAINRAGVDEDR